MSGFKMKYEEAPDPKRGGVVFRTSMLFWVLTSEAGKMYWEEVLIHKEFLIRDQDLVGDGAIEKREMVSIGGRESVRSAFFNILENGKVIADGREIHFDAVSYRPNVILPGEMT